MAHKLNQLPQRPASGTITQKLCKSVMSAYKHVGDVDLTATIRFTIRLSLKESGLKILTTYTCFCFFTECL